MSEFQASNFKKENGGTPDLLGKTEFTSPYFFVPPSGDTVSRPQSCAAGTLRFNTDFGSLEVYRGDTIGWEQIQRRESQYLGGGTGSNAGTGTRAVFAGGYTAYSPYPTTDLIDFITISTLGNAQDFGNLSNAGNVTNSVASTTRGLFHVLNGSHVNSTNKLDFVTISSTGDATDFGDLSQSRGGPGNGGCGSSTRGLFGSGITYSPTSFKDTIDYVTIAQTGNAVDFGNLTVARGDTTAVSSSTRGVWAGGYTPTHQNVMDFVTISTTGNAADFGDMTTTRVRMSGASNSTRGLHFGGQVPTVVNAINFFTIATAGNGMDFGDLTVAKRHSTAVSDPTRAVCYCGDSDTPIRNIIDFVTIASTGNATDFGDGTDERYSLGGVSNGHGGL